jgi:hypothetical protein
MIKEKLACIDIKIWTGDVIGKNNKKKKHALIFEKKNTCVPKNLEKN